MSSTDTFEQYSDYPALASYSQIRSTLKKLKAQSDLLKYSGGLLLWLASISVLLVLWFLVEGLLHPPVLVRIPLMLIWIGSALWAAYIFILKAIIKRTSIEHIAFRLEQCHPELQDRLISSLQLWRELPENKYGYATGFIARTIEDAQVLLDEIDKSGAVADDLRKLKRSGIAIACSLLPLIAVILLFPTNFGNALYTFAHPFENGKQLRTFEIIRVIPGDCKVPHNSDIEIRVEVTEPSPSEAALNYRKEDREWYNVSLSKLATGEDNAEKAVFTGKLENIRESLEYYVSIANVESQRYWITVTQSPIISRLQLELHYPKYTRLEPQSLDANVGNVAAPLGTKVVIEAATSKDIASAFLVFDDKTKTRLDIEESRKLTGGFVIQRNGKYHISITDTDGQSNPDPIEYSVNVLVDQPPRVSIVQPGPDITVGEDMIISLQTQAQDDYGVATMELHFQIEGEDQAHRVALASYGDPRTNILLDYPWDLAPLRLFPEDVISYYVEAADADNVSGPNIGRSDTFVARFPSLYEDYKEIELEQQAEQLEMEDIRNRQDDVKDIVDDLIEELKREKKLDWSGKKELERAAELQKQIEEQAQKLAQQLEETVERMEENPLIDLEAVEKIQELRNLIDELATDEMKQVMRELSEALEQMNPSEQKRDLMSASFKQEEFIERLDRMIELFKNMKLRQKMEVALNQAEELVRQQKEILEQSEQLAEKSADDKEVQNRSEILADREERVEGNVQNLLNEMDEIAEEMKESVPNIGEAVEQIAEQTRQEQIPRDLQCAASELNKSKPQNSLTCQRNALSKMSQLQNSLQSVLEAMTGQDTREIMEALRNAIRSSLYLSHRHEEITQANMDFKGGPEQMLPEEKEIIDSLAVDEIDLAESAQKVANHLRELSQRSTSVSPELVWNMERAADGMKRSAAAMEDKLPELVVPIQRNTLATLNRTIADMLDIMDQMNAQSMPMMGMDDYMEQLRQLAEQQSQLNQSTQGADNIRRRQGLTPSIEEMLEKLSIEQSLIREATERLASKLDKMAEVLGNLEQVAQDMREVEDSLRSGYLTENTMEKQRQILTRLLDYEKSLKKQDFSKQREAQTGREFAVERPASVLPDDATEIQKHIDASMSSPAAERRWPAPYRELIKMYYKALSNTVRK